MHREYDPNALYNRKNVKFKKKIESIQIADLLKQHLSYEFCSAELEMGLSGIKSSIGDTLRITKNLNKTKNNDIDLIVSVLLDFVRFVLFWRIICVFPGR